jgi:Tol biopolymer transport system component
MISSDGKVKVLDFGLAKALQPEAAAPVSAESIAESPTLTAEVTRRGVLLGTSAYMSPEQARGKPVDKRTDIWAYGCVLYEALTGHRAFGGESVTDCLAAVLEREPDWSLLPEATPLLVRSLLKRCLRKDPAKRLHDIADAFLEIEEVQTEKGHPPPGVRAGPTFSIRALIAVLAVTASVVAASLAIVNVVRYQKADGRLLRATILAPPGTTFDLKPDNPGFPVLSPDGTMLAFAARTDDGRSRLFVRPLDSDEAWELPGTDSGGYPFWSPDSQWLAFFSLADHMLKKVEVAGGSPVPICSAIEVKGGSWNPEGTIVYSPAPRGPLHRVSATGGESVPVSRMDAGRGEYSHRFPRFLPDGQHFLYLAKSSGFESAIRVGSLGGNEDRLLLGSPAIAEYADGLLLFFHEAMLMARPFDAASLAFSGDARPLVKDVTLIESVGHGILSAAVDGLLVYGRAQDPIRLQEVGRDGSIRRDLGAPDDIWTVSYSPDGTTAALSIVGRDGRDLWLHDLDRDVRTRLTSMPDHEILGVWSPDGHRMAYRAEGEPAGIRQLSLVGSADEVLLLPGKFGENRCNPTGFSPNGSFLAIEKRAADTGLDIWVLSLDDEHDPRPFIRTRFEEGSGIFSPDGRWLAYASDESGLWEIYMTPFPGPGGKWRVSTNGGLNPSWRSDGREIVFQDAAGQVVAAEVSTDRGSVTIGRVSTLFEVAPCAPPGHGGVVTFAAAPDAQSFLVVTRLALERPRELTLTVNWAATLGDE